LVEAESGHFEPEKIPDKYAETLRELLQAKVEQRAPHIEVATEGKVKPEVNNIMAALKRVCRRGDAQGAGCHAGGTPLFLRGLALDLAAGSIWKRNDKSASDLSFRGWFRPGGLGFTRHQRHCKDRRPADKCPDITTSSVARNSCVTYSRR
jgi:hypothetical protein